jgi:putative inorganic carbon (HCO3(-)) transporter
MAAASMVWPSLLLAAVLTAAFFRVLRFIAYGRLSVRTPADIPIAILLLMLPVTLWATVVPDKTMMQVLRLLSGIGLYYAIANWGDSHKRLRLLVVGLLMAGSFLALLAPFSVVWPISKLPFIPPGWYERFLVIVVDTVHPNVFAGILVLILPIALGLLLEGWPKMNWPERIFCGAVALLLTSLLALSQSRGAWTAAAGAVGLMVLLRFRWSWIGLLGLVGVGIWVINKMGANPLVEAALTSSTIGGLAMRQEIWERAVYMIQDFPLTGIGMGTYMEVADTLYPFFKALPGRITHAHNLFLQIAVDLGIPGLIAWLAIFIIVCFTAGRLVLEGRKLQAPLISGLGLGILGSQCALAIHGMTDAVTWGMVRPAPLVWVIWGLAAAGWLIHNKELEPDRSD